MMLAVVLALMAAGAVIALGWPLLRRVADAPSRAAFDRAVYRDQLTEIARDEERGLIGAEEARAARAEIERRALAVLDSDSADAAPRRSRAAHVIAATLIVTLPALAGIAYLVLGQPQLAGQPFAQRPQAPQAEPTAPPSPETLAAVGQMIEARLAERPDESQGWTLLIRLYRRMGREADATAAWQRAMQGAADDTRRAAIAVAWGEALTGIEGGLIIPAARAAFDEALALSPADPAARFYRGLALAQAGDSAAALAVWRELELTAPADAPWLESLRENIKRLTRDGTPPR